MPTSEEVLIKRSKKGDMAAFEELITPHQQRIYNLAYRMVGNPHDASDIAQEAIIKIYRGLGGFRGEAAFSTWVYRITTNACRDLLIKNNHRRESSLNEYILTEEGEISKEIADYSALPEHGYLEQERAAYLQKLILALPEEYRIALVLREIQGLSYLEIQAALNISLGTVKSRISRGRQALKRKILADAEHFPEILCLLGERRAKI